MYKKKIFKSNNEQVQYVESLYKEIFEEDEYNSFGVSINKGDVVLDLGAHVGIFTQYALDSEASKVVSYESDVTNFQYLQTNINDPRAELRLGYIGHDTITLSDIINHHSFHKINFLKMDIEGSEFDLLEKCENSVFDIVDKWVIEFHTLFHHNLTDWEKKCRMLWRMVCIFEKFSKNNYHIYYEHKHKQWDCVMLYAKKY